MPSRKVCFVTGTRAEYGLLYWVMKDVDADPKLELQLVVTGAHLEGAFGNTVDVIEADDFHIDARVPLGLSDDTPSGIITSAAKALDGIGQALADLRPDLIVLLGDRYEILSAAMAAVVHCIPIAHIHGGEVTEGAMDDAMRHAITKLASLHFAAAEPYRRRIIQMGGVSRVSPANARKIVFSFVMLTLICAPKMHLVDMYQGMPAIGMAYHIKRPAQRHSVRVAGKHRFGPVRGRSCQPIYACQTTRSGLDHPL